jgi:hypothetical protein
MNVGSLVGVQGASGRRLLTSEITQRANLARIDFAMATTASTPKCQHLLLI